MDSEGAPSWSGRPAEHAGFDETIMSSVPTLPPPHPFRAFRNEFRQRLLHATIWVLLRFSYLLWLPLRHFLELYRRLTFHRQRVIVIAGSLGKTTTTRAIWTALEGGVPGGLHEVENSFTWVAWSMVRQLCGRGRAIVEVGIGVPGQMGQYARALRPNVAVMTAIASDHLRKFRDPEHLWQEKSTIVASLPESGVAVLNADDPAVMRMIPLIRSRIVTFGFHPQSDVSVRLEHLSSAGSDVTIMTPAGGLTMRCGLLGEHLVRVLAAAVAVGWIEGVPLDEMQKRLGGFQATPGRMQPIPLPGRGLALCDDFKGGLETFHSALGSFARLPAPRRIAVLGSIYDSPEPRALAYADLARRAAACAGHLVLVGPDATLYAQELHCLPDAPPFDCVTTVDEAAKVLEGLLKPDDLLLIKGDGQQKLARIALHLAGVPVRCRILECPLENILCQTCPCRDVETSDSRRAPPGATDGMA